MILIFGGTTEGKQVIEVLQKLQLQHIYSTKTKIDVVLDDFGQYRHGAFTFASLEEYITENNVELIIHASHPFATELHETISLAAGSCDIPVLRLERQFPERQVSSTVHYVRDYVDALTFIDENFKGKRLLGLTGVQSISKLKSYWLTNTSYFRILDRQISVDMAMESKFPKEQLILGYPNKTIEDEIELIQTLNIELVLTKESGESGALSLKIDAAKACNIPIIILEKPSLPVEFRIVKNKLSLSEALVGMNLKTASIK
mgnify:CR=1 FL=1